MALLEQARKVPLRDWVAYRRILWLSRDRLLFLRQHPNREHAHFHVCVADLTLGKITFLAPLTQRFNRFTGVRWEQSVSPNGRWLLWIDRGRRSSATVASLDGLCCVSWTLDNDCDPMFWTPDSRGIVSTDLSQTYGNVSTLRRLTPPYRPEPYAALPRGIRNVDTLLVVDATRVIVVPFTDGELVQRVPIVHTGLLDNALRQRVTVVSFPTKIALWEACISPDGCWCAWLVGNLPGSAATTSALWVSRTDGSQLRSVGEIRVGPDTIPPAALSWRPYSRTISFSYDGALWVVPTGLA